MNQIIRLSYFGALLLVTAVVPFISCSDTSLEKMNETRVAVKFGTGNIATLRVIHDGRVWLSGDRIGICMMGDGNVLFNGNNKEKAVNIEYMADNSSAVSSFSPVNSQKKIYFPQNSDKVDFIAYYPYIANLNNLTYPVDVTNQKDVRAIDLLYSNNAKAHHRTGGEVILQFTHMLSKLNFSLVEGTGLSASDLTGAMVQITNLSTTARVNLADGKVTADNSGITLTANTSEEGLISSAIIIPQLISSKIIITLAGNNGKFECELPNFTSEMSKQYNYIITVNRTGLTVSSGNITDWKNMDSNPTEGITANIFTIGDFYPDPFATSSDRGLTWKGVKPLGVVIWVNPEDSSQGKVMALKEENAISWIKYENRLLLTEANDMLNGLVNMDIISRLIKTDTRMSAFPAMDRVHKMNPENTNYKNRSETGIWYLPSIAELQLIFSVYNGKVPETWGWPGSDRRYNYPSWGMKPDVEATTLFNNKLINAGGTKISSLSYWSSSEENAHKTWLVDFSQGYTNSVRKKFLYGRVRAIMAF